MYVQKCFQSTWRGWRHKIFENKLTLSFWESHALQNLPNVYFLCSACVAWRAAIQRKDMQRRATWCNVVTFCIDTFLMLLFEPPVVLQQFAYLRQYACHITYRIAHRTCYLFIKSLLRLPSTALWWCSSSRAFFTAFYGICIALACTARTDSSCGAAGRAGQALNKICLLTLSAVASD